MYEPDPTMSAADPVVKARTTDVDVGKPAAAALEAADLNAMPGGQPPGRSLPGKAGAGPENGLGDGYGGGGLASCESMSAHCDRILQGSLRNTRIL